MREVRVQAVASKPEKVVVGRIFPGEDLILGINKICKDNNVKFASLVSALGSLSKSTIVYAVPEEKSKLGIRYCEPTTIKGPLELLSCQGILGEDSKGEFQIHLHGLMSDENMKIYGGHFSLEGNTVLATVEVTLIELEKVSFIRSYDEETDFPLFKFYP